MRLISMLLLVLATAACACAHHHDGAGDHMAADVRFQRQQLDDLFAARRFADLSNFLTEDVQIVGPTKATTGKEGLVGSYETLVKKRPDLVLTFRPTKIEFNSLWRFAAETGQWYESWQEQGDFTELQGSYYAMWKFKDGQWRLYSQILTPLSCKGLRYCKPSE